MALEPDDKRHRDNLVKAAEFLRENGKPKLASTVDLVLGPDGAAFVARLQKELQGRTYEFVVRMPKKNREAIEAATSGRKEVAGILNAGFRRWMDGEFEVRKEPRRRVTEDNPAVALNVMMDLDLHVEAVDRCWELKEAGTRPVIAVSNVAMAILYSHVGLGAYAEAGQATVYRESVQYYLRNDYAAAIDAAGLPEQELTDVVEDGLRRFVAGSFDLRTEARPVAKKGEVNPGRTRRIQLEPGLLAEAADRFKRVQAEEGLPGYMGATTVVAAALLEHFGLGPYAPDAGE